MEQLGTKIEMVIADPVAYIDLVQTLPNEIEEYINLANEPETQEKYSKLWDDEMMQKMDKLKLAYFGKFYSDYKNNIAKSMQEMYKNYTSIISENSQIIANINEKFLELTLLAKTYETNVLNIGKIKNDIKNVSQSPYISISFSPEIDQGISEELEKLNEFLSNLDTECDSNYNEFREISIKKCDCTFRKELFDLQNIFSHYENTYRENKENTESFIREIPETKNETINPETNEIIIGKIKTINSQIDEFISSLGENLCKINIASTPINFSDKFYQVGNTMINMHKEFMNEKQDDLMCNTTLIFESIEENIENIFKISANILEKNTTENFVEKMEAKYNNFIELKAKFKIFAEFLNKLLDLRTGLLNQYKEKQTKATATLRSDQSQRYGAKINVVKNEMEYLASVLKMTGYDRTENLYIPTSDDKFDSVSMVSSIGDISDNVPKSSNGTFEYVGSVCSGIYK